MHNETNLTDTRPATWKFWAIIASVFALFFLRASPKLFIEGRSYVGNWSYTHFLFTYDDGFIKRGLVGDTLNRIFGHVSYELVSTIAYLAFFILAAMMIRLSTQPWHAAGKRQGALLFAIIAVTSPATLQHFAQDVGRFDVFLYLIALPAMYGLSRASGDQRVISFFIVTAPLSLALLIHEAAFFIVAPMVIAYWIFIDSSRRALIYQAATIAIMFIATYLISTRGNYQASSLDVHLESLRAIYGSRVVESSLSVLHNTTLEENIGRTLGTAFDYSRALHHVAMLVFMSPFFYMVFKLARLLRESCPPKALLLLLASLSPLALYPLGHDHFRWWSLAITNIILSTALILIHNRNFSDSLFAYLEDNPRLVKMIVITAFISGPLGVTGSFDILK